MKTPLWLISGYLGAGKTTLLKYMLNIVDEKIAIVMNEFGDIGIDTETISKKNIEVKELLEGCVCCSLTGEFNAAIKELIQNYGPELIVVETTGVAEPEALITDIQEGLENVSLDAVITVVDADTMIRFPKISEIGHIQIETADLLLLNKKNLVTEKQLKELTEKIKSINQRAMIITTNYSEFDIDTIFDLPARPLSKVKEKHSHHSNIEHFSVIPKPFNKQKLDSFLDTLSNVFRLKGHVTIDNKQYLLNYVAGRWNFEETDSKVDKLVFIGEKLLSYKNKIVSDIEKCYT